MKKRDLVTISDESSPYAGQSGEVITTQTVTNNVRGADGKDSLVESQLVSVRLTLANKVIWFYDTQLASND
jgi:hypothetical protein